MSTSTAIMFNGRVSNQLDVLTKFVVGGSETKPNAVALTGATSGSAPVITPQGPDETISLILAAKGLAPVRIMSSGSAVADFSSAANTINRLAFASGGPGQPVAIRALGEANSGLLIAAAASGTITMVSPTVFQGSLTLAGPPTLANHAATKGYVDGLAMGGGSGGGGGVSGYLPIEGGTLTGPLILAGPPVLADQAATKAYVDGSSGGGGVGTAGVRVFSFMVAFANTDPSSFSSVPNGWTISTPNVGQILVQHNVGSRPINATVWGRTPVEDTWTQRSVGNLSLNMTYSRSSLTTFTINGVSTSSTGAGTGLQAEFNIFFGA